MSKSLWRSIVLLFVLLIVSCGFPPGKKSIPEEKYQSFFKLATEEQHNKIKTLNINDQLAIYYYAVTNIHPPDISFANDIAQEGQPIVPNLIEELKRVESERKQQAIILIFEMMVRFHKYIPGDDVINLIENKVKAMQLPAQKELSEESLNIIKMKL